MPAPGAGPGADRCGDDLDRRRAGGAATSCTSSPRCRGTWTTPSSRAGTGGSCATTTSRGPGHARPSVPDRQGEHPGRALAFGGFTALATVEGAGARRPDVVLAMSPPLTLGPAGAVVARARRVPFVFNIQDVFPDVAIEVGALANPTAIAAAQRLERASYLAADAVTVLSDDLADNVRAKVGPAAADRVRVIPNFVDTQRIRPASRDNAYRREFGLEGRRVVMYAGNLGFSQSVELLLDAARAFADDPDLGDVVAVVNGGGSRRQELEARAAGLDNVRFVDLQPAARLPEVLAAADVHTVLLRRGLARSSVPSKLYSILAAGRPVLASVDAGTEVATTIERAGAGISVAPEDPEAFTAALRRLLAHPAGTAAMGAAGRAFVEGWASPAAVAEAYEALFLELVDRRRRRGRR
ncbi:MAG: glycosyltransferase family 4 protein [Acidimicrobiales bacterium]